MANKEDVVNYFSAIAQRYDLVNHVLSFNCDRAWRRRLVRLSEIQSGQSLIDLCTGTGDILIAMHRQCPTCQLTGLDLTEPMLDLARTKLDRLGADVTLLPGDAVQVPVDNGAFDVVTMGFGLRNLEDPMQGLREMARILKPGGKALILEFAPAPKGGFGAVYNLYLRFIIPVLGGIITGSKQAYRHLSTSIQGFFEPDHFVQSMGTAGFNAVEAVPLSGGIAYIYQGTKLDLKTS
jgi:demethylmenaquinone methyltransferase/2-methoxy-6-polyprenyl-1,4-benzoquinol methylase